MRGLLDEEKAKLIESAKIGRDNAYAPYSDFRVGSALMTKSGKIYIGSNIENVVFSITNCAERSALFSAVSNGDREFTALAVISSGGNYCMPCGICRQALYEFSPELTVLCCRDNGEYKEYTLKELLPHPFDISGGGEK